MAEVAGQIDRFPQVLENVTVSARDGLDAATRVWDAVRAAEARLDGNGRVLVRSSGTEPLVRVMVEAGSEEEARAHAIGHRRGGADLPGLTRGPGGPLRPR